MAHSKEEPNTGDVIVQNASEAGTMGGYQVVGKPLPRKDTVEKVTGAAVFGPDVSFPDMLHAAIYQSPHAHAKILSYDLEMAKAVPGVRLVLIGEELPAVLDPYEAMQPGSPLVHESWSEYTHTSEFTAVDETNLCDHFPLRCGDV